METEVLKTILALLRKTQDNVPSFAKFLVLMDWEETVAAGGGQASVPRESCFPEQPIKR